MDLAPLVQAWVRMRFASAQALRAEFPGAEATPSR
jgi:hypothetical protein